MKSFILFACLVAGIASANTAPAVDCEKKEEALKEEASKDVEKELPEQK